MLAVVRVVVIELQQRLDCPMWIVAWYWNIVSTIGNYYRWQATAADSREHPYERYAFALQMVASMGTEIVVAVAAEAEPEFVELGLLSVDLTG